jgi:antirestriction protein ArdC
MPNNATSQRRDSGVNVLLLWGEGSRRDIDTTAGSRSSKHAGLGGT